MIDHDFGEPFWLEMRSAIGSARACSAALSRAIAAAALLGRHRGPRALVEGLPRRRDGLVDVGGRGVRHPADDLLAVRRDDVDGGAALGGDPLAADEELIVDLHGRTPGSRFGTERAAG